MAAPPRWPPAGPQISLAVGDGGPSCGRPSSVCFPVSEAPDTSPSLTGAWPSLEETVFFFFFLFLSFLFLLSYLPCRWGAKAVTEASGLQCSLPPPPWDLVLIQTLRVNKNDPTYLFIYLLLLLNHSHLRVHLCLPFFLWCPGYRPYCLNCGWALPRIQQTLPLSCRDNYQPCLACHSFLWVKPW